ncbi:5441_t:CDS:2 [Cetraspora pellucida]|uniref:5441_t:CDS:1 n=1 Tax=Cetraspora pellucida TaxID=1433469 RepID=A0ACA9LHK8_9GLOM|nr:5441_t:CDS:2 [Cetraspora pellucida]
MKNALELQKHSFPSLIALDKWENQIQELVIRHCPKLQSLDASNNQKLANFDLDNCSNLETIHLFGNPKLNDLNLAGSQRIRELKLDHTNLNNLDLSLITQLQKIDISRSKLTKLDVGNCLQLSDLNCSHNQLTKLKLGKLEHLTCLNCGDNQLQELGINQCLKLKSLNCSNNLLTELQLANNNQLEKLDIGNNNFSQDLVIFSKLKNLEELRKIQTDNSYCGKLLKLVTDIPLRLLNQRGEEIGENYDYEGIKYQGFALRDARSRKDKKAAEKLKITYQQGSKEDEKELTMTKWGKKALEKARKEQNQEVPKMGIYYGNAEVTLISINTQAEEENLNKKNKKEFALETLKKIDVNELEDKISLRLYEALKAVKNRRRGTAVDGVYSILGLLPYGEKVKVEYKERGHKYTKEELKIETKDDVENGKIHGSINIQGGTNVFCQPDSLEFVKTGIKLNGLKYPIKGTGFRSKEATSTGFFSLQVYREDKNDVNASSSLWGLEKTLKLVKKGDILVIPNEEE